MKSTRIDDLARLHAEIDMCRICEPFVPDYQKPIALDRGEPGTVMIVGQGPGKAEARASRAFAGNAGTRLDNWLVASGADRTAPRAGIYLTSILKCVSRDAGKIPLMARRCDHFLIRQMTILRPALVITLGRSAYERLRFSESSYEDNLCNLQSSRKVLLLAEFGFHFDLLPWPHPSGRNRWLNLDENRMRLEATFPLVRPYIRGAA